MTKQELKTVRVNASMTTDLYVDINVPVNLDKEDLYRLIRSYQLINSGDMTVHFDFWGDWIWKDEHVTDFNSDAMDMSDKINELLERDACKAVLKKLNKLDQENNDG